MGSLVRKVAVAAVAVVVASQAGAVPAGAVAPACGDTITQSMTLTADLGPCPNFGLRIGADGITLDLGGRRILGTGAKGDGAGVYLLGRRGVTVRNGTVSGFDAGVAIEGGGANTVRGLTLESNIGGSGTLFGDGVAILSSVDNVVAANTVRNSGPFSGIGIFSLVDADHNRPTQGVSSGNQILDNVVVGNIAPREGVAQAGTDNDGIRVEPNSMSNTISRNYVAGNGLDGIALFRGAANNTVTQNIVEGNGFYRVTARRGSGIILFNLANNNLVEGNTVRGNADNGIVVQGPLGSTAGSTGNTIRFNTATGNSARPPLNPVFGGPFGGQTYDLQDRNPSCGTNTWFANRFGTAFADCTKAAGTQL